MCNINIDEFSHVYEKKHRFCVIKHHRRRFERYWRKLLINAHIRRYTIFDPSSDRDSMNAGIKLRNAIGE